MIAFYNNEIHICFIKPVWIRFTRYINQFQVWIRQVPMTWEWGLSWKHDPTPLLESVFKEKRSLPDVSFSFLLTSFPSLYLLFTPFPFLYPNNVAHLLVHFHCHRFIETTFTHSGPLCIRFGKHATYSSFWTTTIHSIIIFTKPWAYCYPSFVTFDDSFEQCIPSWLYTQPC